MKGEFENRLKSVIEETKSQPQAHHPFHRRGAYADRRRRPGRPERCGQSPEAGPGARRIADDRCDHLGRIQEVLREGRRPHPPLPAREGRGAERENGHRHDPRPRLDPRAASQGSHPRRGGERRRAPVGALHPGPPVAGQGRQPDRHRLRPRGDEPERHTGADRRLPAPARPDRHRAEDHRARDGGGRRSLRPAQRLDGRATAHHRRTGQAERTLGGRTRSRDQDRCGAREDRCRRSDHGQRRRRCRQERRPDRARRARGPVDAPAHAAGRTAAHLSHGRRPGDCRDRRGVDRHPGPPHADRRNPHRAQPARGDGTPGRRPKPRPGSRRAGHPHQPGRLDRSAPAGRRFPVRRHVGRRQDRDRAHPGRSSSTAENKTPPPSTWRSSRRSTKSAC